MGPRVVPARPEGVDRAPGARRDDGTDEPAARVHRGRARWWALFRPQRRRRVGSARGGGGAPPDASEGARVGRTFEAGGLQPPEPVRTVIRPTLARRAVALWSRMSRTRVAYVVLPS